MNNDFYILYWVGGILISVISFFLKDTIDQLKQLKKDVRSSEIQIAKNESEIILLRQDHNSKIENMTQRLVELSENVKDLTKEVKSLTMELSKKKED